MSIFEDKLRKSFGFPTKKESLDFQIRTYKIREKMALDQSLATRQQAISYLEEQIRQIESIIEDNQVFIDCYESIKSKAQEKVKLATNPLRSPIYDLNNEEIINANYCAIERYFETLKRKNISPQLISSYLRQQALILERMWLFYASEVIKGKGLYKGDNSDFGECYDIYTCYCEALSLMKSERLKTANRDIVIIDEIGIFFLIKAKSNAEKFNQELIALLADLKIRITKAKSSQSDDEYAKQEIESAQTVMRSSSEYFAAVKSEEFLRKLDELKR